MPQIYLYQLKMAHVLAFEAKKNYFFFIIQRMMFIPCQDTTPTQNYFIRFHKPLHFYNACINEFTIHSKQSQLHVSKMMSNMWSLKMLYYLVLVLWHSQIYLVQTVPSALLTDYKIQVLAVICMKTVQTSKGSIKSPTQKN